MYEILLVIHTILVLFLIGIILIQRSDSDGFGTGGGANNFMTGRASANAITRATAILATLFIINSLVLAYMTTKRAHTSIVGTVEKVEGATTETPAAEKPAAAPSVPKPE